MVGCRPGVPGPQSVQDRSHILIASVRPSQPPAFASKWVHHPTVVGVVAVEGAAVVHPGLLLHLELEEAVVVAVAQGPAAKMAEVEEGAAWAVRVGMVRRCHNHRAPAMTTRWAVEAEGTSTTDLRSPRRRPSARTPCLLGTVPGVAVCKRHRGCVHRQKQKARHSPYGHREVVAEVFGRRWDCNRRLKATTSLVQLAAAAVFRTYFVRAGKRLLRPEVAEWETLVRSM